MWPYVLLIILPVMVQRLKLRDGSIRIYKQNTKDSIAMPMFWCFLLTLLVLRHETVGIDLSTYKNIFESICPSSIFLIPGMSNVSRLGDVLVFF